MRRDFTFQEACFRFVAPLGAFLTVLCDEVGALRQQVGQHWLARKRVFANWHGVNALYLIVVVLLCQTIQTITGVINPPRNQPLLFEPFCNFRRDRQTGVCPHFAVTPAAALCRNFLFTPLARFVGHYRLPSAFFK
jgi:hypothetical protein